MNIFLQTFLEKCDEKKFEVDDLGVKCDDLQEQGYIAQDDPYVKQVQFIT